MSGANASPTGRSHQEMSDAVIFKDLPATFPERDKFKKPSFLGSIAFHGLLIFAVVIVPLLMPQTISQRELLITLVSPIGPPPPPPPPAVEIPVVAAPKPVQPQVRSVTPDTLMAPIVIPKEVLKIVEEPTAPAVGVIGGVPGGVPGGVAGGVLGGILAANAPPPSVVAPPPPPPPPPPPKAIASIEPVRVGGVVKEPRVVRMTPPVYPPLASRARVSGTVILEATLTAQGTVEQIRVVDGHPLLIEAAINCVKQWQYEPTYLNGVPVPVILTAKVHFIKAPIS
jgi:periplasmic protein TonB